MTSRRAGDREPLADAKLAQKEHEERPQEMKDKSAEKNMAKVRCTLETQKPCRTVGEATSPQTPFSDPQRATPWVFLLYKPCEPSQRAKNV